ncbi:MAG: biotin/lipoyl-containing protein [Dehalococcoidia bacterium]|mgnify:FL=1|nr:hypothetical protein [Chloroflexota bacterium]|tara:strand:- start:1470 stop:1892 length:423 start_codon:yes stop_codon:yes gene_type:complete
MKKYNFEIDGKKFEVEVNLLNSNDAQVKVNDKNFDIKISNNLSEPKKSEPKKSEPKKSEPKIPDQSVQGNPGDLLALMPGKILKVLVSEGQKIKMGEPVIIMESMKMEQTIVSSTDGVINSINVNEGETIEVGSVMIVIG